VDGIAQVFLSAEDVVRHRLVKEIIKAYEADDEAWRQHKMAQDARRNNTTRSMPDKTEEASTNE
jgi:phosphate starvation-inducible PhoH-like protein